jgi:hypothetical protein
MLIARRAVAGGSIMLYQRLATACDESELRSADAISRSAAAALVVWWLLTTVLDSEAKV